MQKYTCHYTQIVQKIMQGFLHLWAWHWERRTELVFDWGRHMIKDHRSGLSCIIWRTFPPLFWDVVSSWTSSWILWASHHLAMGSGTTSQSSQTCLRIFTNVDFPAAMFPSMKIFLMRVPSELVVGDRQLLLGRVAPSRLGREGWEVATGSWATALTQRGLL